MVESMIAIQNESGDRRIEFEGARPSMAVIQSSAPGEGYKKITIDLDKSMIDALIAALNFYKGV